MSSLRVLCIEANGTPVVVNVRIVCGGVHVTQLECFSQSRKETTILRGNRHAEYSQRGEHSPFEFGSDQSYRIAGVTVKELDDRSTESLGLDRIFIIVFAPEYLW